jgi:beta-N-acetylhexosaminidase
MTSPRACITSIAGTVLSADEASFLAEAQPWGVILMGRSCTGPDQVRALVDSIWGALGRAALVFIDQEGGRVRRLRPPNWPDFPAPARYGRVHAMDADLGREAAWLGHRLIAAELAPMGVHANCAPVLDLLHPGAHSIVGDRSFGVDPAGIAELGQAALKGLADGGVAGVIKHLPGHGRAQVDSHESMPVVREGRGALEPDFAAFRPLAHSPMGMTCHLAFEAIDGMTPSTLSERIIGEVIRGDIGFTGLLMTDDLGMKALGGTLASRAKRARGAGCDIVLHCSGFEKDPAVILSEMQEVAEASGELSGVSLQRAREAERASGAPRPFDRAAGWARLEELLAAGESAGA